MKMFLNLTPHVVNVYSENEELILVIPTAGTIRLQEKTELSGSVAGIPLVAKYTSGVSVLLSEDIPTVVNPAIIIVSRPVGEAIARNLQLRVKLTHSLLFKGIEVDTFVCPDTGDDSALRDEEGRIYGVRRFCVFK